MRTSGGVKTVKMNPLFRPDAELRELSARLITAASMGDMITCASITERYGVGLLNKGDYDGRTPIHLACSENQLGVLRYFCTRKGIVVDCIDRWGSTPLDDAKKNGATLAVELLERLLVESGRDVGNEDGRDVMYGRMD